MYVDVVGLLQLRVPAIVTEYISQLCKYFTFSGCIFIPCICNIESQKVESLYFSSVITVASCEKTQKWEK